MGVGYFNRPGPDKVKFLSENGLEVAFFELHCIMACHECPTLTFRMSQKFRKKLTILTYNVATRAFTWTPSHGLN